MTMPNPTPAYTLEECVGMCEAGGVTEAVLQRSLLHHLRAAQADAARLAKLGELLGHFVAASEVTDDDAVAYVDAETVKSAREALRALGPLKEPMP